MSSILCWGTAAACMSYCSDMVVPSCFPGDAMTVRGDVSISAAIVDAGSTKMLLGLQQPSSEIEGDDIGTEVV